MLHRFKMVYIPSAQTETRGGIRNDQNEAMVGRLADIVYYVNELGGSLVALAQVTVLHVDKH